MRNLVVVGVLLIFIITFAGPIMAQEAPIPDQIKKFEPVIGLWKNQEEFRDSPMSSWEKSSSEWEYSWLLERHCVRVDGKTSTEGPYLEIMGFDPQLNTIIGYGFDTIGGKWSFTSAGWDGGVLNFNVTDSHPGRSDIIARCSFVFPSDFKSFTGTCEQFTDGKWWVLRKVKGTKVK